MYGKSYSFFGLAFLSLAAIPLEGLAGETIIRHREPMSTPPAQRSSLGSAVRIPGGNQDSSARPKKSGLYTRTGDQGTSSLYNGTRRSKDDAVFEALGAVDELNSLLGIAHLYCEKSANGLAESLEAIQCSLMEIGSNIATPRSTSTEKQRENTTFDEDHVTVLEEWTDRIDEQLPTLKNFILPSGGESAVFLHQARSVCRRAERASIPLSEEIDGSVLRYLNRLSDYLFAAARFAAMHEKRTETVFRKERGARPAMIAKRELGGQ